MKNASILNENYMTYNHTVDNTLNEMNKELRVKFDDIEEAISVLFEAEDLSTEAPEYFTFKHTQCIKELLKEDYESGLRAVISNNKDKMSYGLAKAVKCAGLNQVLFENAETKLQSLNEVFGENSVLNESCDAVTADGSDVRKAVKKMIPLYENAMSKIDYILKTISNTPEDKSTLVENLEILATVKTFIDEMK